jgi:hypothetical protein
MMQFSASFWPHEVTVLLPLVLEGPQAWIVYLPSVILLSTLELTNGVIIFHDTETPDRLIFTITQPSNLIISDTVLSTLQSLILAVLKCQKTPRY